MAAPRLAFTWLGHSTFIIDLPNGKRILTDPWLENPKCPEAFTKPESLAPIDLILTSHGHFDHIGTAVAASRATGAPRSGARARLASQRDGGTALYRAGRRGSRRR